MQSTLDEAAFRDRTAGANIPQMGSAGIRLEEFSMGRAPKNDFTQYVSFPEITFQEFKALPYKIQKDLIARNRIINTDTYNRTMDELSSKLLDSSVTTKVHNEATFTLQMRRSPFGYLVANGVHDMVEELTLLPISKAELNFAREYYQHIKGVKFFNDKMWTEIVENQGGKLPFEIHGMPDGSVVLPGEPMLTVRGPEELIAHFEQNFHRLFYPTLVGTRSHALLQILGDSDRFIEVGKRGAITEEQHQQAMKAMYVSGGFTMTSNDAGVGLLPLRATGTMGHRYVQRFSSEEAAFRHAIENLELVVLLVDLVDTYKGIDLSLKLKQEYRSTGKPIWMRLDSGDILDQVRYFLTKTNELGLTDPRLDKVVVEGIDGFEDIIEIEQMIEKEFGAEAKKRVIYGAGGLLISQQTSRSDASSGFKITRYADENGEMQNSMKFSNSPGKGSYPGELRVVVVGGQRLIAQLDEQIEGNVTNLFEPLYMGGMMLCDPKDTESARARVKTQFAAASDAAAATKSKLADMRGKPSPATQVIIDQIKAKYGVQ